MDTTLSSRFQFCVIMAALMHMLLILGITWKLPQSNQIAAHTIEITLASTPSHAPPKIAPFMASLQQEASSPKHTDLAPQHPEETHMSSSLQTINEIPQPHAQTSTPETRNSITTNRPTTEQLLAAHDPDIDANANFSSTQTQTQTLEQQLVQLATELAQTQQYYAQQLRTKTVSAETMATDEADYLYHWRLYMERIGNQHYPATARRLGLRGEVLLGVSIAADGSLYDVKIHKSSGSKILDEAALQTVRLAAPFAPLPPEIRKNTDILNILRLWQFTP